jgi:hypothetical protein
MLQTHQAQRVGLGARLWAALVGMGAFLAVVLLAVAVGGAVGWHLAPKFVTAVGTTVGIAVALALIERAKQPRTGA